VKKLLFLIPAVLLGCATAKPTLTTHQQMVAIAAKYKASHVNIDNWSQADRDEFNRLLALEVQGK
jgi:hypothetical protein